MANTRRKLKPYKGYPITKVNGYMYMSDVPGESALVSYSLDGIKKEIDNYIEKKN